MSDFQKEKSLVLNFINEVDNASENNLIEKISKYTSNNFNMKCTHPFNEIKGIEEFATKFWFPIKNHLSLSKEEWISFMLAQI